MSKNKVTYVDLIAKMYEMQCGFNVKIHPEWNKQNFSFHTAIVTETSEGIGSFAWKWWKKQTDDYQNYVVELVDLWHFIMSQDAQDVLNDETLFGEYFEDTAGDWRPYIYDCFPDYPLCKSVDTSSKACLAELDLIMEAQYEFKRGEIGSIDVCYALINAWLRTVGDIDALYKFYIGKNVLNAFRQDNGYATGTYKKLWGKAKEEDNVVMMRILEDLDATDDMNEKVYAKLQFEYAKN